MQICDSKYMKPRQHHMGRGIWYDRVKILTDEFYHYQKISWRSCVILCIDITVDVWLEVKVQEEFFSLDPAIREASIRTK